MPDLERRGDVFLLRLGDGENRWTPEWIRSFIAALDEVEATPEPRALVTVSSGKYWSTGLDLSWLEANPAEMPTLGNLFHAVLARTLTLAVPCVAAVSGHAFGAGAMLALAHDFRVMADNRGFWCLPEADLGLAFTDASAALVQAKLPPAAAHRAMVTAYRYGGEEAAAAGIVDAAVPEAAVLDAAMALAQPLTGKPAKTTAEIKHRMYATVHAQLVEDAGR